MDCLFCKIANKEMVADVVYENDGAVGVLDVHPVAPGHTMILPKVHAENILDLPKNKIEPVFIAVNEMTKKLQEIFNPDGFTIGINHGKVSGQAVDHLHIHIIPRFKGDGGKSIHSVVDNSPESLAEIKEKFK
jgi:histidine triad (HIT) family protein